MDDQRGGRSLGSTVFWFALSLVVMAINFRSATRGSWLALGLGVLALVGVITYGRVLLAWYQDYRARGRR